MKNLKVMAKRLWADESGQGATEYILLLVVVVALALMFRTKIQETLRTKLEELGQAIGAFQVGGG